LQTTRAVHGGGADKPSLLLSRVVQRLGEMEVTAHAGHAARERHDGVPDRLSLEIAKHIVAVAHRFSGAQRR
jgi:hypothetical protein